MDVKYRPPRIKKPLPSPEDPHPDKEALNEPPEITGVHSQNSQPGTSLRTSQSGLSHGETSHAGTSQAGNSQAGTNQAGNSQAEFKHTTPRGSLRSVDEENILLDVERTIATLERSIQYKETVIDIDSGDESTTRARKLKIAGKRLLK